MHKKFSTRNSYLPHLSAKKSFSKCVKYFWRYSISAQDSVKGKIEIFTFSGFWKCCNVAIAKPKYLRTWNFQPKYPPSLSFSQKKIFENSLNIFEDIAFLAGQCKGKNWNFYIFWILESCNVAIAKPNFLCTRHFQPKYPPSSSFRQKKVFENSSNTFEDIAFLLGTV